MDEKMKKIIFIVLGSFFILFLFLFILTSCKKKLDPTELEEEIVKSAKSYYKIHDDELPGKDSVTRITLSDLVAKEVIDDLEKLLNKKTTCTGTLTIENNNDYYMYSPDISCTEDTTKYDTVNLKEKLLENIVTSGNGLYQIGTSYYFRGDNVENNIIFDGIEWKIIGITTDGYIRLIETNKRKNTVWDDRYNGDRKSAVGINEYTYDGINSRIKDELDNIYNTEEVLSNDAKGFIKKTTLCIGKRNENDTGIDGSIECSKTLEDQYLGLLQINEYMVASLDKNCTTTISPACKNYNYLANFTNSYWTLTADASNTHKIFKINQMPFASNAKGSGTAKMVINISENTSVSGTGKEDDPYIVIGLDEELKKLK